MVTRFGNHYYPKLKGLISKPTPERRLRRCYRFRRRNHKQPEAHTCVIISRKNSGRCWAVVFLAFDAPDIWYHDWAWADRYVGPEHGWVPSPINGGFLQQFLSEVEFHRSRNSGGGYVGYF